MVFINKLNQLDLTQILALIKKNWLMMLIVLAAALLRTWQIDSQGILFGDAARDLYAAQEAIENRQLPLLGIPSSVPRFHQGPLTIWLEMFVYALFGHSTLAFSITFAFLGILAVITVYEYSVVFINKPTAIVASALLSFSPLAVALSRVPYHTNPIPLTIMLYLFALQYLWQKRKWGTLVAGLAWILCLQFELTLFPLGLLIPYIWWRRQIKITPQVISQICAATLMGLLPQIIHDLTHPIAQSQLGGFTIWVGYRLISLTGVIGGHKLSGVRLGITWQAFRTYLSKIFSTQLLPISLFFAGLFVSTTTKAVKKRRHLNIGIELVTMMLVILTLSYIAHGSPSEAYFPPYFPLLSIFLGWGLTQLFQTRLKLLGLILIVWAGINTASILSHRFFVSNPQTFSYHASLKEQRQILQIISKISHNYFQLQTTQPEGKFASYFANFYWLGEELEIGPANPDGMVFYIETKNSGLSGYPNITKLEFNTYDVYYH